MSLLEIRIEGIERLRERFRDMPDLLNRAAAEGINRTAAAIEQHEYVEIERKIDRPTPFTMNSIKIYKASSRGSRPPAALVKLQPLQAKYLRHTIFGGKFEKMIVPGRKGRLNQYGNIPGKQKGLKGIAERGRKRFVATIDGKTGVFQRRGKRRLPIDVLAWVDEDVTRLKRFDFYGVAQDIADRRLRRDVLAAIRAEIDRRGNT